jgi:hypothetical protein
MTMTSVFKNALSFSADHFGQIFPLSIVIRAFAFRNIFASSKGQFTQAILAVRF